MRISLVGSYNLADGYLGAAKALRKKGVEVNFVPAHFYFSEYPSDHVDKIIDDVKKQDPDIVLWWRSETLNEAQLKNIKNKINKPFILYSWDDPNQFDDKHNNIKDKVKYFDTCFTCCEGSIETYLELGAKKAIYCLPGFDPEVHYQEYDEKYVCDISLVCTNLYHGNSITNHHHISRKVLLELLINNFPNLDIRIYGSESIKNIFPNNYAGWINFNESRKVFYNSKININTHIRPDGYKYLNERTFQIMGSEGCLLVDHVNGIEKILGHEYDCFYMDLSSVDAFLNQVSNILIDEDKRERVRRQAELTASKYYKWKNWADKILENVTE